MKSENQIIEERLIQWYAKQNGLKLDNLLSLKKLIAFYNQGTHINYIMTVLPSKWLNYHADKSQVIQHFEKLVDLQKEINNFETDFNNPINK